MWPMLTGIGPILGDGAVGSFVAADGNVTWFYQDGKTGTRNPAGLETVSLTLEEEPVSPIRCGRRSSRWQHGQLSRSHRHRFPWPARHPLLRNPNGRQIHRRAALQAG